MSTNSKTEEKRNFVSSFVLGAKNGLNMGLTSMIPNVVFAFAMIQVLNLSGLSDLIAKVCGPIMGILGLPGIAATALVAGFLSLGGGMGAAASLALAGSITGSDATILCVGIMISGAFIQYIGRILGAAGVKSKHFPVIFAVNIGCTFVAMLVTSFIVGR